MRRYNEGILERFTHSPCNLLQLNFLWSLIYNCLSIPIATGLFFPLIHTRLPPTLAAVAMALSSISVVGSSLALRLYQPPAVGRGAHTSASSRSSAWHGQRPRPSRRASRQQRRQVALGTDDDTEHDLTEPLLQASDGNEPTERTSNVSEDVEAPVIVAV